MLTGDISSQVLEHREFESLIEKITENARRTPTVFLLDEAQKMLKKIRNNYPRQIYNAYYDQYRAILEEFYK